MLIESSGTIKDHLKVLDRIYSQTIGEIRRIDPHRLIFITPAYTSSPFHLNELNVTNDGYTLVEWHIYASGPKGCSYNESYIEEATSTAFTWSKRKGIPTWLGAWRPNFYPKGERRNGRPLCPMVLQLNFTRAMVSALSRAGIPYDINSDVHFFDIANLTWYESQEKPLRLFSILHIGCGDDLSNFPRLLLADALNFFKLLFGCGKNALHVAEVTEEPLR